MSKKITLSIIVNKNRKEVYEFLKKLNTFPLFVKNINKIDVLDRFPNRIITAWEANIDGAIVIWKEEDVFNDFNTCIEFSMIKGDFKDYKGKWVITDYKKGAKIDLSVEFDWGIPAFEIIIGDILARKAKVYLKGMLKAIKNKLGATK